MGEEILNTRQFTLSNRLKVHTLSNHLINGYWRWGKEF